MTKSIYKEIILDHYRNPRNYGKLKDATHSADSNNPLCGDKLFIDMIVEGDIISDIKFHGKGCAISMASASMLTERLKSQPLAAIQEINEAEIQKMLGVELSPSRVKCAMLAIRVMSQSTR
ncbi:Fe-S cluster assembly sulfur transfer protein SufU [Patescibacteria group bacterium]